MIKYLTADQLGDYPKLQLTMLQDRASQFRQRLKWEVSVDDQGCERDGYDLLNPLYVIWQSPDGTHGGSMRFMPTTGRTMVNDVFSHLTNGRIEHRKIWETTRFCVSPRAQNGAGIAAHLMLAGAQFGISQGLEHAVGVFDARMIRIYRGLGWLPKILGTQGKGRDAISAGLWDFAPDLLGPLSRKAGVSAEVSAHWYACAFGAGQTGIAA